MFGRHSFKGFNPEIEVHSESNYCVRHHYTVGVCDHISLA